MRLFLAALLLIFAAPAQAAYDPLEWAECSTIGVPFESPTANPPAVFVNSTDDEQIPSGEWVTITLKDVPQETQAVHFTGILMITKETQRYEIVNMTVRFRNTGGSDPRLFDYVGQVVTIEFSGVRSPFAGWIPVTDRQFDIYWARSTPVGYPENPALGFRIYIDAYCR